MPPSKESTPLPLVADRAALSNRISLLLSSQSSILKSMNLQPRPTSTATTKRPTQIDDDDDLLKGTRPNEGVGYAPDKKLAPVSNTKEDRMLRGRGKGKGKDNGKAKWKEESESEEEVGRSALGKRKRPRREVVEVEEATSDHVAEVKTEDQDEQAKTEDQEDTKMDDTPAEATETMETKEVEDSAGGDKKKRKRKKKKSKNKNKEASD